MMCGSSRAFQKHIVLGVLEDVLGGLWTSVGVGYFLAGEAPARTSTPVGGCTESRARARRTSGWAPEQETGEILLTTFLHRPSFTLLSMMLSSSGPELTSLTRAAARRELRTQSAHFRATQAATAALSRRRGGQPRSDMSRSDILRTGTAI